MKKILSKIRKRLPTGLAAKLIRAVVVIFLLLGLLFFTVSTLQLHVLGELVDREGEQQTARVDKASRESMDKLTRDSLKSLSYNTADLTDDELWVNGYELRLLGAQVEDVIRNPGNYERIPVYPPDRKNGGELALQLLTPNGYENVPPQTMEMMERLANLKPLMATIVGEYTIDVYIALPDGTALAVDRLSDQKFDENGNLRLYDATTRPWYQEAVKKGGLYFSPATLSYFYGFPEVLYSLPVYVDNRLVAVLEGTLKIDSLQDKVEARLLGETGFNVLISKEGQLVCTSRKSGELSMREDLTEDIRTTVNPGLAGLITLGLSGESGTATVEVDGELYYAGYGPLVTVGWTQVSFVSVNEIMEPSKQLTGELSSSFAGMDRRIEGAFGNTIVILLLVMGVIVVGSIIVVARLARRRVAPINEMTKQVKAISGENLIFEMQEIYKTGDEIETLARSFEEQSVKLGDYMTENIRISAEKERIDAEMSMATQIQESMLPKVTGAFSEREEFELFANMVPAKNVGGDFYDFFFLDEDHLAFEVSDVSGKGITGALFMALSKQMIQSQMLLSGRDVAQALSVANLRLLEESIPDMFVTVWLGVLTLSTGDLTFVDAGHEYPAIRKNGGPFVIDRDIHSVSVAAIKKAKFKPNETRLEPGDTIYLYTDGVTEAHNEAGEMFGMERLAAALNEAADLSPEEIDAQVRRRIAEFTGEAEQYDDITTLCLEYLGKEASQEDKAETGH